MSKRRENSKYNRYSESFLERLDNMKSDKDYNPYEVSKRHITDENELYNETVYTETDETEDEEQSEKGGGGIVLVIVLILVLVLIVGGLFILFRG